MTASQVRVVFERFGSLQVEVVEELGEHCLDVIKLVGVAGENVRRGAPVLAAVEPLRIDLMDLGQLLDVVPLDAAALFSALVRAECDADEIG